MPETLRSAGVLSDRLRVTDLPEITDLLLASKKAQLTLTGHSMYPALRGGDLVDVDPLVKETLEVGDLVVFQKERLVVCHRLTEIFDQNGETWIRTKGDTVKEGDSPMKLRQILGRVSRIERNGLSLVPASSPQKCSLREHILLFFLKKRLGNRFKTTLRPLFVQCQSFLFFRILYRLLVHPNVTYSVGIPTSSTVDPKFWHYLPTLPIKEEHLRGADKSAYRFLAKVKGNIVGSLEVKVSGEENRSEWVISHLFVRVKYRGCGIATTLLKLGFQMLRRQKVPLLKVNVAPEDCPARSLLRRLGFEGASQEEPTVLIRKLPFSSHFLGRKGGLEASFYPLISSHPSTFFPSDRMEIFKESLIQNAARLLLSEQTLFKIDTVFKKAGIPFLVQKGMAIAYLLYPDPAMRPMVDIDLYLRKTDIPVAAALLKDLGYEMNHSEFQEELLSFGGELSFCKKGSPIVELHWHLEQYERFKGIVKIDEQALWDHAVSYEISGKKFLTLCPEHQLLSLSIHLGLIHRFRGLKWFLDIDRLVVLYGEDLNWEEFFQTARAWGVERVVCQTLLETQELFDTPLPPLPMRKRAFLLKVVAFQWLLVDRFEDRFRVILRVFFPSREWLVYRYHLKERRWVHLFRPLHPFLVLTGRTK